MDVFRKRSSVSAFRIAALCQYLYEIENNSSPASRESAKDTIQKRVRQIYLYMAEYILDGMLARWGKTFEELNAKRENGLKTGPAVSIFDQLTDTFTREQLNLLIEKTGKTTPDKIFICRWKKLHVIEIIDKNTFRKLNVKK